MRVTIFTIPAVLMLVSCAPRSAPERPVVLVSVPPQAWLVERLADDLVDVEVMVPSGADPHVYEPTIAQMRAAGEAAVYVKVGHPNFSFERAWFERFRAENPRMRVVAGPPGAVRDDADPHPWTSVAAMRAMATPAAAALLEALPERADTLRARLAATLADLDTLDAALRLMLAPCRGRSFLVFHPAWGYFAADYGLEQIAIERDGKAPAPADLARIIAAARAARVRRVFATPQTNPSGARVVADEIGAEVVTLDPLDRDWAAGMRRMAAEIAAGCDE
jgi:zinc transport system substrate-binding protein